VPHPTWQAEPDDEHYAAAARYLSLVADPATVAGLMALFEKAVAVSYQSKDLLRAAGLLALPTTSSHVARDIGKILAGTPLSPVLVVRGDIRAGTALVVADGYHRISACHALDENAEVVCRMVALSDVKARRLTHRPSPPSAR
jgi:hypothetical protein